MKVERVKKIIMHLNQLTAPEKEQNSRKPVELLIRILPALAALQTGRLIEVKAAGAGIVGEMHEPAALRTRPEGGKGKRGERG
jgi:hypothetical protein